MFSFTTNSICSFLIVFLIQSIRSSELSEGRILLNVSNSKVDQDGFYRLSNYEFKCLRRLSICSSNGFSVRLKLFLESIETVERERKILLFSSGAHEPHGDGLIIYLYQTKNVSYFEFGLKEFNDEEFANYWQIEADLEAQRWIDVVVAIGKRETAKHHQMKIFFDGRFYRETQSENFTEIFVFQYDQVQPKNVLIYGNQSTFVKLDQIFYYETILTAPQIAQVPIDRIFVGCFRETDLLHQYLVPLIQSDWKLCREECFSRRMKVGLFSAKTNQCGCALNSFEFDRSFKLVETCRCSLFDLEKGKTCSENDEWNVFSVSNVIDSTDSEVGLEIVLADSSLLHDGRTRVQRNEGVEIIVTVKNERNLASLTVYGDIEGHEATNSNSASNEIYITAGVVNLSWKNEGSKKVHFRADYRRMVNGETAEYRTVYVDVVYVKTDLPIQFVNLSPGTPNGISFHNFTVQTFGSIPINCSMNFGDGHKQINGTSRDQYYTAFFSRNYTRHGQYNVSVRCYNERSSKTISFIRTVRPENLRRKQIIEKDLSFAPSPTRFILPSREDFFFSQPNCLTLRNLVTTEQLQLIWRKKNLEIIPENIIPVGKHFFQLECDSFPLQMYIINVQPTIHSVDIEASQTIVKSRQPVEFSITLEPTVDLTIIFDCAASGEPIKVLRLETVSNYSSIPVGNCSFSKPGVYFPLVKIFNRVNSINQSIRIDVEEPLSQFKVEVEDRPDITQLTLITIRALEQISFEGIFTITIFDAHDYNERNQTRTERIQLFKSNNFTEHLYLNITTYGKQKVHVRGGDFPNYREAQATFTIGTEITTLPQVFVVNPIGSVNFDVVWVDVQWIDGIGFDVRIQFGDEKKFLLRYEQIINALLNRTMKKSDGIDEFLWKRLAKQHLQIGHKFSKVGNHKISVSFVQPSSKSLHAHIKCPTVTIVQRNVQSDRNCLSKGNFSLQSRQAANSVTPTSPVLFLPWNLAHELEVQLPSNCEENEFLYSFYVLSFEQSRWKYTKLNRYPASSINRFQETFLPEFCSEFRSKSTLTINEKQLPYGFYIVSLTISRASNPSDFQQILQPIEIVRSDLQSKFDGNETITIDGQMIELDFYSTTIDPDGPEVERRKMNFTLICYPEQQESEIFGPNPIELGSTRPTEPNPQNQNSWSIQWNLLKAVVRRPELNIQFFESQCFPPTQKKNKQRDFVHFNPKRKTLNFTEEQLSFENETLHFLLIVRHLNDGRQLIARRIFNKNMNLLFEGADLNLLEEAMSNLENLASENPKRAVELINGLADKLNEMSDNTTTSEMSSDEVKTMNDRMTSMRSKMLSSMDTVLNSADDPSMVNKALKASVTVTANSAQMPLDNQEKGAGIIEKVGSKVKDMESADESTITGLATTLMDVGGNVLQAASKTVGKDINGDKTWMIEAAENEMNQTSDEETDTKVIFAPTEFYDACDDCDTLPEERWEQYRQKLIDDKKNIIEGRERASAIAKRSATGLFTVGDALANRSESDEPKSIQSKTMAMTLAKASPDGKSSLSAGDTNIRLPGLGSLNNGTNGSEATTKILEAKENPYASATGNSTVQGSVVTIIISRTDGSEIPVDDASQPISIRLKRPVDKTPKAQFHHVQGNQFQYHRLELPDEKMALSVLVAPEYPGDTYAIYISHDLNETLVETPTETKFDLLFLVPNSTLSANISDLDPDDQIEIQNTVFLPPGVHLGNGTYIIGVKLINSSLASNLTTYNSSYMVNMYTSKCQYWDEKNFVWSSAGCQVGPMSTLKSTECLCTHLTTFGGDFYVPPNTIDFKTVFKKFKKLHENAAVFSMVMIVFGLYIIAAIWARRKDRQDLIKWTASPLVDNLPIDNYYYLITVHTGVGKESGTTSNVSMVLSGELADSGVRKLSDGKIQGFQSGSVRNFLMSVESPLGPLLYLRVWHDNSGHKSKASWYLNMINVMDLQTGEKNYFLCDDWLAVERGDGLVDRVIPLATIKELKSFSHLFTQSVKKKFSDGHLWFSVFSRPVRSNFTRLQRISCCVSLLFCTMISNAMFYRQETDATKNKAGTLMKIGPIQFTMTQLWVSFIGTMVVLPVNLLVVTLFRKAKYSQRTLISQQKRERKRQRKVLKTDEQYQKTNRFFSRGKSRKEESENILDDEPERIAALPSVEDKTRTLPHWTIYIAWILVSLSMLTCSFFIILYSLEWGAKRANEWLMTMMLSFGQSVLVIDPLKVFLITAVISFLIRRPYDDETLDFNDPFTGLLISNQITADSKFDNLDENTRIKDIARQRRVRLFDLRPIDSNEMARAREQRLRELKMGEIIREIVVYVCFTTVLLFLSYQARDTNSYGLYRDTKNLFITDDFNDVSSLGSWWDYCDNVLLKGLYAQPWYNQKNLTWREKLTTASRVSMRVGAPRIRQLRVKDNSCRVHRQVKHVIKHCRDDYNWFDDDTKDYSVGWKEVLNKSAAIMSDEENNGTKRCRTPWCYQSSARTKSGPMTAIYKTYKGGGYVVSLGRTYEKARNVLEELRSQNWLDQFTRALIVDFSLYNANVNLFASITLSFEMTSMGSVIQDYQIKVFRLYDHVGGFGIIVYTFEFIFVVFTIYSMIHEIRNVIKFRRIYFDKFWNLVSFITAVLSVTAIGMYGTKKSLTRLAIRALRKSEMGEFVNFNSIASFDEVYSAVVAMITFFTMLKFLKLLRFNQRIGMLSLSLRYARSDLNSFGFVFLIFMLAYAHMGFSMFNRSLPNFKNFFTSLTTCFRMLLGEINAPDMFAVSRVYGTFYFLSFIVLVFIALLSIFLTILNDSFAHVKRELAMHQHKNEMIDFMWSTFQKVAGVKRKKASNQDEDSNNAALKSMESQSDAPLANFDGDDL